MMQKKLLGTVDRPELGANLPLRIIAPCDHLSIEVTGAKD